MSKFTAKHKSKELTIKRETKDFHSFWNLLRKEDHNPCDFIIYNYDPDIKK